MYLTTAAVLTAALAAHVPPDRPKHTPVALEQKLVGEWTSGLDCVGNFTFRADGTYERNHFGPGSATLAGVWKVRWDELPPTLVLTVETSSDKDFIGKPWEMQISRLNEKTLEYDFGPNEGGHRFTRKTK